MKAFFDLSGIAEYFSDNSANQPVIITSNRRLANEIDAAFDQQDTIAERQSWLKPDIFPVEEWITHCWKQLLLQGDDGALAIRPISSSQDLLLWEQIIREDRAAALLKPYATAKSAQAAQQTLTLWQTPASDAFEFHPDCARFSGWLKRYQQLCRKRGFANTAMLGDLANNAFKQGRLRPHDALLTIGFQQLPPLYHSLFRHGSRRLHVYESKPAPTTTYCKGYDQVEQEIKAAAAWMKTQLEKNPLQRIALVVPDLKARRKQIERIFNAEFEPQYILPETPRYQPPFNISAGIVLGETPVIHTALLLFKACLGPLDTQEWLTLLHNPFILRQQSFQVSLCVAEERIRRSGFSQLSAQQIRRILAGQPQPDEAISDWLNALETMTQSMESNNTINAPLAHWREMLNAHLDAFQWPGQRSLDSVEYQQVKRWKGLLDEFLGLSDICGEVSLEAMFRLLQQFVCATEFQAESAKSPIQILGMLEGGGLSFDAIWLVSVNDRYWPAAPSPNPFIPVSVQIKADMPHASADRELGFTRNLFNEYLHGTRTLVASYALWDKDQPLLPSHLLAQMGMATDIPDNLNSYPHPYYELIAQSSDLVCLTDVQASEIGKTGGSLRGGAQVLKNQAACPFKAFAIHRLMAAQMDSPTHYLNARDRGVMLHRALELFWKKTKDQQHLQQLHADQLDDVIRQAATSAVLKQADQRPDLFSESLVQLEIDRLIQLIHTWLDVELQRQPFTTIETEYAAAIEIAGISLNVRIDRIDQLKDGSLVLIDYKTGACSVTQWQGDRPDDPQLPFYAVSLPTTDPINALAFAQVNIDKQRFIGVAKQDSVASGISTPEQIKGWEMAHEWEALKAQWRLHMETLMAAFSSGDANVSPKNRSVCRNCHLGSLCRVKDSRSFGEPSS